MKERLKKYFHSLKWVLNNAKEYRFRILLMLVFNLAVIGASLYTVILSKQIIDNASLSLSITGIIVLYIIIMLAMQLIGAAGSLLSTLIEEKVSFGKTVTAYNLESRTIDEFTKASDSLTKTGIIADIIGNAMGPLMNMLNNCSFVLVAAIGA